MSANPLVSGIGLSDVEIIVRQASVPMVNTADAADGTLSVAVPDVEIGDLVLPVANVDGQGHIVGCVASGNNTIDFSWHNASGGAVNIATQTWNFIIFKTGAR